MAYKANKNNVETVLIQFPRNEKGYYVRTTKITNSVSGDVSYDIRNLYTDENGDVQFTSKGVRLKEDEFANILKAILIDMDAEKYNAIITDVEMAESSDTSETGTEGDAELSNNSEVSERE